MIRYVSIALAIAAIAAALSVLLTPLGQLELLERKSLDSRFRIRGPILHDRDILIVAIDEATIGYLQGKGVGPYATAATDAEVIGNLREWGASVIAFDRLYEESHGDDALLVKVARKDEMSDIVWGCYLKPDGEIVQPVDAVKEAFDFGFLNLSNDRDAFIRRVAVAHRDEKSFALLTAEKHTELDLSFRYADSPQIIINYRGPPKTFPTVPYWQVHRGEISQEVLQSRGAANPEELFEGKIVLVGVTAVGSSDHAPTPFFGGKGSYTSGVEIQANIVDNLLKGDTITRIGAAKAILIAVFLAFICALLTIRAPLLVAIPVTVFALFSFYSISVWYFMAENLWVDQVQPVCAMFVAPVIAMAVRSFRERQARLAVQREFETLREEKAALEAVLNIAGDERIASSLDEGVSGSTQPEAKTQITDSCGYEIGAPPTSEYKIVERLGSGGGGVVWKVRNLFLERLEAIKILQPGAVNDPVAAERFRREAAAAARIKHENIIQIYRMGRSQDYFFFTMECIDGGDLSRLIRSSKELPIENFFDIATQIVHGVKAAHDAGIIHRDLKPRNVLVEESGRVVITDFGLANVTFLESLTLERGIMGTILYMSPEQARKLPADERSDLYSLGVVLYEMLAGQPPIQAENPLAILANIPTEEPTPVRTHNPDTAEALEAIVMKLLAKEPDERYQTAHDLLSELERVRSL